MIAAPASAGASQSLVELAILVAVSTAAAVVVLWLRFPGGLMFGSMMASAVLHGTGYVMRAAVVAGSAAVIGSARWPARASPARRSSELLRYLGAAFGSFAVAMAIAAMFA